MEWVGEEWGFVRGLIISTEGFGEHSILHYSSLGLWLGTDYIEDWILFPIWGCYFDVPLDIGGVDNLPRIGNEDRLAYRGCHENLYCGMLCTWYVCKFFLKYAQGISLAR